MIVPIDALSSDRYRFKGILINGYGPSANAGTAAIEQQLNRFGGPTVVG